MHVFDQDTRSAPLDAGRLALDISGRYDIGTVPNGGYVLAAAARALCAATQRPDVLTITAHYLNPVRAGSATLGVDVTPGGRRTACAGAVLEQNGAVCTRFLATCTDLSRHAGVSWTDAAPPSLPPFAQCPSAPHDAVAREPFHEAVDVRLDPALAGWRAGGAERAEMRGWFAFPDGRAPDVFALLLFADSMPPPVFRVLGPVGWVPTLELTVHIRARPAPGPIAGVFRTHHLTGGLLEEDGTLWDSTGTLVAVSRQLALVRNPAPGPKS